MKKTTKGALAAGAAGVLLLGGAGSLAYWSDSETVDGGAIESGELSLTQETGQSCSDWTLDSAGGTTTYVPGTTLLVPGDVVTRSCDYTVNAQGEHLAATLDIDDSAITGDTELAAALSVDATYTLGATPVADGASITAANNDQVLSAEIAVTFDSATSGDVAQVQSATLNDIAVTLTQIHP